MNKTISLKRAFVLYLRYSPTIGVFCFMIHYSLLVFGVRTILPDYIIDVSLFALIFLMLSSFLFGFCPLHRAFISYIGLGSLDIDLHHWISLRLFPWDWCMPVIMASLGFLLFVLLGARIITHKKQNN